MVAIFFIFTNKTIEISLFHSFFHLNLAKIRSFGEPEEIKTIMWTSAILLAAILYGCPETSAQQESVEVVNARVFLAGKMQVNGVLNLTETPSAGGVRIIGRIVGLSPGNHGFHVHQFGDVFSNGCDSTGPHYNPSKSLHGAPQDGADQRHAGDLGNIVANSDGVANINVIDRIISLTGPQSIVGRAFVVHAAEDDLGRFKENDGSTKTGNAGARLACGIVAIVP